MVRPASVGGVSGLPRKVETGFNPVARSAAMSHADTALIVIDAQESFRQRPYWREEGVAAYIERQQALIDGAAAAGIPVVRIFHVEPLGPFSEVSGFVTTMA